jgi:transposase
MTPSRLSSEQELDVVAEYKRGLSLRDLARRFGVSTRPIQRVLAKHGVQLRPTGRHEQQIPEAEVEQLRRAYDAGQTMAEIAAASEYPRAAIRRALEATGGIRQRGPGAVGFTDTQRQEIVARFKGGETQVALGSAFDCGATTIVRVLREAGIEAGTHGQVREHHHSWKGGRRVRDDGYVDVRVARDDVIAQAMKRKNGYVSEHRLVMARFLGRPLLPDEEPHHKNGVRSDNRIKNLELASSSHPRGQRVTDLVEWAHEILDRYGDNRLP